MNLNEAFKQCAVLGAAGKMGRGISLLVLEEMVRLELETEGCTGSGKYNLILVDSNEKAFSNLKAYLRTQLIKYAEKKIISLRKAYAGQKQLVSNFEIIEAFVQPAIDAVICSTILESASKALLVFEALSEDISLKNEAFFILSQNATHPQYYFSNTSSIPISLLNSAGNLNNQIVGLHFYNPPPIQKLVEICFPYNSDEQAYVFALDIAQRFGKTTVSSKDIPGFIGNGYFMRELAFANAFFNELSNAIGPASALFSINFLTKEFLLRPMGIFELADYVGIDICNNIAETMADLLKEEMLISPLISQMHELGIRGGSGPNGSREPGFFKYDSKGSMTAVYDISKKTYIDLDSPAIIQAQQKLGAFPEGRLSWKQLEKCTENDAIKKYFCNFAKNNSPGCMLSLEYLRACHNIAKVLVSAGIAQSSDDVNTVLKLGFHHPYGPLETWIEDIIQQQEARP